ncbi:MAG: methionine--tRNA ligase [Nanoarchaeota archaeon]|nr:methionine--tRNA ligase [Nanoarchaeota archaeon]
MKEKFYITTTIPYANAAPHIGFALELLQADVLARWNQQKGKDVFFLTGTDEHGVKNYQTAKKQGLNTQKFVDKNSKLFKELVKKLNISNNNFLRTTDKKNHWKGVEEMWKLLEKKGDLVKKKYSGKYCSGCERFVTEKDLVEGKCPDHPRLKIQKISEENYFFKLSKYSDKIKKLIEEDKLEIYPKKWKNNFLGLITDGLTDVSFSRNKEQLPWGIPVPGDKDQVMYVWCDALTNYLTGLGYPDKKYKKYWPANIHVVGKDMLRFHTGIWPGMLLSAGLPLPKKIIVHGFLTVDGKKMSKSTGNVIEPINLLKKYSVDSVRYFLARNFVFGDDGDFSEKALVNRHNGELSNKLGNLVSRVTSLIEKYGISDEMYDATHLNFNFKKFEKLMQNYELDKALNEIFAFIDDCNEYVQETKPWKTKDKRVLYELANAIKKISILLYAFIPETCEKIAKKFGGWEFDFKEFDKPLDVKVNIVKGEGLFERIEFENINKGEEIENIMTTKAPFSVSQNKEYEGKVNFEDWSKLDLRVAEIKKAEEIEGADKLYKFTLDVGELGERIICAGIKEYYSKKDLVGKKIIYFSNLKPRKMRGIESQGMLLAASTEDHKKVILISPEGEINNGAKVG